MDERQIDYSEAEALGISREAYDEVLGIVGRIPTIEELSTLLAMWQSCGTRKSLYAWLRGQQHAVHLDDYLYSGTADHRAIREPKVKECLAIAHGLMSGERRAESGERRVENGEWRVESGERRVESGERRVERGERRTERDFNFQFSIFNSKDLATGLLLYMVGNVSAEFATGEYARYLHLVEEPMAVAGHEEDCQYIEMILGAMHEGGLSSGHRPVTMGGLFCSLLEWVAPWGFDILAPREVRLDAFLFGEEPGRYLAVTDEQHDDAFLLKLDEARLNCCFLGRTTKNRVMVDGYDFGLVADFAAKR